MVQIHGIRRASADAKYRQMTGQPVKPLILKLCLPAVISNLVTTAYNLTDTFFIGQLGTAQSGAIGIAFSIMTVMQALGFFFGNGAGNSMSRELGKQNNERASRLLAVGFAGAVLSGLVIAAIGLLTLRPLVVMLAGLILSWRFRLNARTHETLMAEIERLMIASFERESHWQPLEADPA